MPTDLDKAKLMYKLAIAKRNWGAKYDRLEHFKRFRDLDKMVKELTNLSWIILYRKPNYKAISLNPRYKKEIISFIEKQIPELKGMNSID